MTTKKAKKKAAGKVNGRQPTVQSTQANVQDSGPKWTFLTNHAHVLILLDSEPDLVLRHVASRIGITERAVQRIIVDLEESGFLQRERVGRQNRYTVRKNKPLRHSIEAHRNIGDLLEMLKS